MKKDMTPRIFQVHGIMSNEGLAANKQEDTQNSFEKRMGIGHPAVSVTTPNCIKQATPSIFANNGRFADNNVLPSFSWN